MFAGYGHSLTGLRRRNIWTQHEIVEVIPGARCFGVIVVLWTCDLSQGSLSLWTPASYVNSNVSSTPEFYGI